MTVCTSVAPTAAVVNFSVPNNATWTDAIEFTDPDETGWSLTGQSFVMELKGNPNDTSPLLELTSAAGEIVVVSAADRIIQFNVPYSALVAALKVGEYVYDFIMYDNSIPPVRTMLMQGIVDLTQGITGEP